MSKIKSSLFAVIIVFGSVSAIIYPMTKPSCMVTVSAAFVEEQEDFGAGGDNGGQSEPPSPDQTEAPAPSREPASDAKPALTGEVEGAGAGAGSSKGKMTGTSKGTEKSGISSLKTKTSPAGGDEQPEQAGRETLEQEDSSKSSGQAYKREQRSERALEKTAQKEEAAKDSAWSVPETYEMDEHEPFPDPEETEAEPVGTDPAETETEEERQETAAEEGALEAADAVEPEDVDIVETPVRRTGSILLPLGCLLLGVGVLRWLLHLRKK